MAKEGIGAERQLSVPDTPIVAYRNELFGALSNEQWELQQPTPNPHPTIQILVHCRRSIYFQVIFVFAAETGGRTEHSYARYVVAGL